MKHILATFIAMLLLGGNIFCVFGEPPRKLSDAEMQEFRKKMIENLEPKIAPALYPQIVKKQKENCEKYEFLPDFIPEQAVKVAFFHIRRFLQDSDIIILRVELPDESLKSILEELEKSGRKEIVSLDEFPSKHMYPAYDMKKPSLKNRFEYVSALPKGFRIFLFESDIENIKEYWNHNTLAFTAVSMEKREVVYFIERW